MEENHQVGKSETVKCVGSTLFTIQFLRVSIPETLLHVTLKKTNRNIGLYFCSSSAVFPLVLKEFDNNYILLGTFFRKYRLIFL